MPKDLWESWNERSALYDYSSSLQHWLPMLLAEICTVFLQESCLAIGGRGGMAASVYWSGSLLSLGLVFNGCKRFAQASQAAIACRGDAPTGSPSFSLLLFALGCTGKLGSLLFLLWFLGDAGPGELRSFGIGSILLLASLMLFFALDARLRSQVSASSG